MLKMNAKKENRNGRKSSAAAESNSLLISSKLMADLKNSGIVAFKQMSDDEQKRVWNWSKEVIKEYRSVLEAHPSNIRNIEDLPFPKEDIQLAIKLSLPLYLSKDMQSVVKLLKNAYREIGTFQSIKDIDKKKLLSRKNLKRRESSRDNKTIYALPHKYMALAITEQKVLLQDINDFVTDLESVMKDNRVET